MLDPLDIGRPLDTVRILRAGDDEAARLFRQALTLTREVEQTRILLARLNGIAQPTPEEQAKAASVSRELASLQANQAATVRASSAGAPSNRVRRWVMAMSPGSDL